MKLAIFGASGRTGTYLLQQALAADYEVVVLVRSLEKVPVKNDLLTLIQGDAMNAADVEKAVQGVDAVISVLGQRKDSPRDMQTVAMRNIVAAMQKYDVKRLVSLTGAGVDSPQDRPKLLHHIIKLALKTLSGHVLKDAIQHVEVIKNSQLDWTVVRGPMLNEGPYTGTYRIGWVGVNTGPRISRANVADFLLKQVTDTTYLRQAPMISD